MRNFQRKRIWENVMESKPVLILLGILVLFFSWNVFLFWNKMQETKKNEEIVANNVSSLQQRKNSLSDKINNLNTDQGKEQFIRENYGLAKDGEDMIVITEDKTQIPTLKPTNSGFFSFLFFWKNWFK